MPQLSVIVPFYNVQAYAAQTIQSLRRNAARGIEFLLVDDASTDATPDILAAHVERLPGGRVITNPVNIGLAAGRNVGLSQAAGEYITYLDGDDFVAPGYYPKLLSTIQRLGCEMVRVDHVRVRGRDRKIHRITHGPRGVVLNPRDSILPVDRATSVDAPNAWAGIYHRSLADAGLLHFTEHLRTCEDRPWNWRLHLGAGSFAVVGLLGVFYRRDVTNSLTRISDTRQFDFLKAFDQIVDDFVRDKDADRLLPKALRSYCAMICHHVGRLNTYEPELADELVRLSREALQRLPQRELTPVIAGMDLSRANTINNLMESA